MANQRKKGIERVTLTLPDEMLKRLESEAESSGKDRLALMREIIGDYLLASQRPKSSSSDEAKPTKRRAKK